MPDFDYSQYDNGDDYTTVDAIYDMIHQADNTSRPMSILLECYNKYENHTSEADAIANDKEALDWLDDYWEYVCLVEHGNEGSIEEIGGFKGMIEYITDPEMAGQVIDYLQYDDEIDEDAQDLINRLKQITSRYNGVSKMKKSIDIEQLARDVTDLYEDIDPYAIRDVFDSIEEAYEGNLDALMTWNSDEIQRSIIDNLQEYADEGYTGNGSISVTDVISRLKELTATKSTKKMKKSSFDSIPQTFYIDMKDGRSITFSKEEYPMGVRWLHDNKDVRFYSTEGEEVFPVLQFSDNDNGRALMLFEEKDWANDYYGEYTDAVGINAVVEFEEFINDVLSDDVYIDYGDEEVMESTKKSIPSIHDMIAQTRANNNSLVKSRVDLGIKKLRFPSQITINIKGTPVVFDKQKDATLYYVANSNSFKNDNGDSMDITLEDIEDNNAKVTIYSDAPWGGGIDITYQGLIYFNDINEMLEKFEVSCNNHVGQVM